jgi:hypothetical protein
VEWLYTSIELLCAVGFLLTTWLRLFFISTSRWMATVGTITMALLWALTCNAQGPRFLYVLLIVVACVLLAIPGSKATPAVSGAEHF